MALENVEQFEKLLREDEVLQEKLVSAVDAYEGEQTAEAIYEALLEPIAAGVGLPFTYEEAVRFGSLGRELSDAELDGLAGGSICIFVGFGDDPDAEVIDDSNGGACAYVGVTLANWG